LLTYLEIDLSL